MSEKQAPAIDPRITSGMVASVWAERQPDVPAVISKHATRSFRELNARANQLVRALRTRDIKQGSTVALICSNRPEFAETLSATRRSGLRLVPINWHLSADEMAYILDDCEATAVIGDALFGEEVQKARAKAPGVRIALAVGGPITGFEGYEAALAAESDADIEDPQLGRQMLYTSGTTGRPKGVDRPAIASSQPRTNSALGPLASYQAGVDRHLLTGPLYHAAPLAFSLQVPLMFGASVVMMDKWNAEETLRLIQEYNITHSHMVPTMFSRLLALPQDVKDAYDVSTLKFVLHGAAPCPVPVKKALMDWWGPIIHEYYAATEGFGCVVSAEDWLKRPGTVGKPASEDHIKIMDDEGNPLPAGKAGKVYLKAPAQGRFRYYKDDHKTATAYRDNYFTLGDVGYLDEEGWLFLTDRSVNLIISGGVNIYPAEVEAVMIMHPKVGDVAVIGVPNEDWGEEVKAVVEPQTGVTPSPELAQELVTYCRDRIAHFKCPKSVDFVEQLPRHDNGKLYKQKLREMYRDT